MRTEEAPLTSEAAVLTQVGGVLLYGSADEEIPFLRHGATNPPLAHREFEILEAELEEERGTRVTRGYAYAPWRRLGVCLRRRRRGAGGRAGVHLLLRRRRRQGRERR
jgi:hypothetical protein